jgi:hypothetical protein
VKYSATPKTTAAINHAIHGMEAASRPNRLPRKYLAGMPAAHDALCAKSRIRCSPDRRSRR